VRSDRFVVSSLGARRTFTVLSRASLRARSWQLRRSLLLATLCS
jgi:hypothetical protein